MMYYKNFGPKSNKKSHLQKMKVKQREHDVEVYT